MQGAYYTPDDVVEFIIEKTLTPIIFRKMIEGLKKAGWTEVDLRAYQSIDDILDPNAPIKNPKYVHQMLDSISSIRVLDPACGSGHFLTAMLSEILRVKVSLLSTIDENVDRFKLKREIISHNIFGVDIDQNAVEIARLRLWLSLIEEVNVSNSQHIETLPNIDFNTISGNALIGWLNESLSIHPLINLSEDTYVKETLLNLERIYKADIDNVTSLLQNMGIGDTIRAYEKLIGIYSLESGESSVKLRETLENIRNKLYELINSSFIQFLFENSRLTRRGEEHKELTSNLPNRTPFHWHVDFGDTFADSGGFDAVVGNPPYIEDGSYDDFDLEIVRWTKPISKRKRKKEPLFYMSRDCGNTHAYFIERSIRLLNQNGRFGFIVPISLVSTDRMSSIREFIHDNSSEVTYFNFDDRPGKIFRGIEHCRSTIVITQKGTGLDELTTSKYHRWHTKDRANLFKELKTTKWCITRPQDIIPKIGMEIEKEILTKLEKKAKKKMIKNFLEEDGIRIWYHNAPQYWIHSHTDEYLPKVEYYDNYKENEKGEKTLSGLMKTESTSQYKSFIFTAEKSFIVNCLLNCSLFYWWFVIWSDGRHLLSQHIENFPLNLSDFQQDLTRKLNILSIELMESYEKNSNIKINVRSGGYAIKIKEIIPLKSKSIIDKIDEVFADYFEFTEDEKGFIKEFDIEFRS